MEKFISTAICSQLVKQRYLFSRMFWYSELGTLLITPVISLFKSTSLSISWLISSCKSTILQIASAIEELLLPLLLGIPEIVEVHFFAKSFRLDTCCIFEFILSSRYLAWFKYSFAVMLPSPF